MPGDADAKPLKLKPFLLGGFLIAVLAMIAWAISGTPARADYDILRAEDHVIFERANVQFDLQAGWETVQPASLPKEVGSVEFAFRKTGTSCILAYVKGYPFGNYRQTSFADRVFGPGDPHTREQYDSSWMLHISDLPEGFKFRWEGKQSFPGEVRPVLVGWFGSTRVYGYFVLYDEQGSIVADECNTDFNTVLESMQAFYRSTQLSQQSKGVLYRWADRTLYVSDDDTPRVVADNSDGGQIYDNKIFYTGRSYVYSFDPFTGEYKTYDVLLNERERVLQIYIYGEYAYIVAGEEECEYLSECTERLMRLNLSTEDSEFLINARGILGFDPGESALYLSDVWGDAGCWSEQVSRYRVDSMTLESVGAFSGCADEEGVDPAYEAYQQAVKGVHRMETRVVLVSDGELRPAPVDFEIDQMNGFNHGDGFGFVLAPGQ